MPTAVSRSQVLAYRVLAQQLPREGRHADAAVLDLGVQDTGPDGAGWALAIRGASPEPAALITAWTLRGAPHVYRRADIAGVADATAPASEADAAKRIFDGSRPLRAAGIGIVEALDQVAAAMRAIAIEPVAKGAMSSGLAARLPAPYQRDCRPCGTTHVYEQTFRLAALRAGLELRPGTSPPVLERIPGWAGAAKSFDARLDPVRGVLRFLGPVTPRHVARYLDAPVKEVAANWPADTAEVTVDGERRWILHADLESLTSAAVEPAMARLLGPFDLYLQGRDRETVVPVEADRKDLWRTLGRPGGVLVGHEIVGSWRPRAGGSRLKVATRPWQAWSPDAVRAIADQAERLAAFRGVRFDGFVES
ncbi:MAG: DNA glycosylase AlkZ-like family protein [Nocardioides sp.]